MLVLNKLILKKKLKNKNSKNQLRAIMIDTDRLKYFQYDTQMFENCKLQSTRSGMHSKRLFYKNASVILRNS
jgi:hypothetical protein